MAILVGRPTAMRSLAMLLGTTMLAAGLLAPAHAQEVPIPPPFMDVDVNGVDLTSGIYSVGIPVWLDRIGRWPAEPRGLFRWRSGQQSAEWVSAAW
jgi:hypothetical protein